MKSASLRFVRALPPSSFIVLISHQFALRPAQILGDELIKKLNSAKWDTREDALRKIKDRLDTERGIGCSDADIDRLPFFNACCCVMRKAMNDKVAPVYFAACSLLDTLLETCSNDLNSDDIQVQHSTVNCCKSPAIFGCSVNLLFVIGWDHASHEHHHCQDRRHESARDGTYLQRHLGGISICLTPLEEQPADGLFESSVCSVACIILQLARKQKVGLDFVARYLTMQHKSMRKLRLVWGRLDLVRRSMLEFGFKRSTIFTAGVSNHAATVSIPWHDSRTFVFYRR
eukprot:SAG31_NODE_1020_length_10349_cov_5.621561_3_plen_287_part_00